MQWAGIAATDAAVKIRLIKAIANLRGGNGLIDGLFIPIIHTGTANPLLPLNLIATTLRPQAFAGFAACAGQNQKKQQQGHNGAGQ